jgi:CHAT domain-containing protein
MALVVPADSGLPLAPIERDAILALADGGRNVSPIPANFLELQRALASGEYDGWHFTGHGAHRTPDPNKAVIVLQKGQTFTPDNLAGEIRRLGQARPFVFLNACQTGRGGMSLTGISGWAREFLVCGAGAFIGTYWSVFDRPACDFASALYARLLGGEPIGKAVQDARAVIRNSGGLTWLAYTVFADPTATLTRA